MMMRSLQVKLKHKTRNNRLKTANPLWLAALGGLSIGLVCGATLLHPTLAQQGPDAPPGNGAPGTPLPGPLERILPRLNLTPEQETKIRAILEAQRRQMNQRINEVLTPQQRVLFEQLTTPPGARRAGQDAQANQGGNDNAPMTNRVSITTEGDYRYIRSNGIPDHPMGQFPNAHNPNTASEQQYNYRMTLHPQVARQTAALGMNPFGVALNGVPFDPSANEFWNRNRRSGWQYEPLSPVVNLGLDENNAHVQPNGAYHYHGLPMGLMNELHATTHMTLLGYAADGYPLYSPYCYSDPQNPQSPLKAMQSSYRLKPGTRPDGAQGEGPGGTYDGTFIQDYTYVRGSGDLDECNGRTGVTPEYPHGTYYYVLSENWPIIPRLYKGTPDRSFLHLPPGGGQGFGGRGPGEGFNGGPGGGGPGGPDFGGPGEGPPGGGPPGGGPPGGGPPGGGPGGPDFGPPPGGPPFDGPGAN